MQARFYAPWYGRFLSPDPARDQHFEETQSWNIYSYVQNNPTMKIDPTGESAWDAIGGAIYAIADNASMGIVGQIAQHGFGFNVQAQNRDFYQGAAAGSAVTGGVGTGAAAGGGGATVALLSTGVLAPGAAVTVTVAAYGGAVAAKSAVAGVTYAAMAANAPASGGGEAKPSSDGRMQQEVVRDQAPREVDSVHPAHTEKGGEPHIHYKDGTSSNRSGGTHDKKGGTPNPSKKTREWIKKHNWTPPPKPDSKK